MNLGPVNLGTPASSSGAWAGGAGLFSISGTEPAGPFVVILENENSGAGVWQPSPSSNADLTGAGDVAVRSVGEQIPFNLPAGDYRIRIVGADAVTSITGHMN
jgi:hypothetical protein